MARENWRDGDAEAGVAFIKSFGGDPSQADFTTGATGWMRWDFDKAKTMCLYDEPAACVDYFQRLREALPSMYQCILEFNRRGRIPSEHVRTSMRLFTDEVLPKLN